MKHWVTYPMVVMRSVIIPNAPASPTPPTP